MTKKGFIFHISMVLELIQFYYCFVILLGVGGNIGSLKGIARPRPKANAPGKTPELTKGEWQEHNGHKSDSNGTANADAHPDVVTSHQGGEEDLRNKDTVETSSVTVEIPPKDDSGNSTAVILPSERRSSFKSEMVVSITPKQKSPHKEASVTVPVDLQLDAAAVADSNEIFVEKEADTEGDANKTEITCPGEPVEEAIVPIKVEKEVEHTPPAIKLSTEGSEAVEGESGVDKKEQSKEVATAGVTLSLELNRPKPLPVSEDDGGSLSRSEVSEQ